jgi:hypothetical protein
MTNRIKFTVELTDKNNVPIKEEGSCDALILHNIFFHGDGSRGELILGYDSKTGEKTSSNELWKSWAITAFQLAQKEDLDTGKKMLCKEVANILQEALMKVDCVSGRCSIYKN